MFDILKDIGSGALPVSEIPSFFAWAFRKVAGLIVLIVIVSMIIALAAKAL